MPLTGLLDSSVFEGGVKRYIPEVLRVYILRALLRNFKIIKGYKGFNVKLN